MRRHRPVTRDAKAPAAAKTVVLEISGARNVGSGENWDAMLEEWQTSMSAAASSHTKPNLMLSIDSIYVQVYRDRIAAKNIASGESSVVMRDMSFASPRMLVADFTTAQHQIKEAIKAVKRGLRAPEVLVHPMELIEGGITQVEYRVFVELALGAGASKAAVYSGVPLQDASIKPAIREYKH